jgi:hypothetical protein
MLEKINGMFYFSPLKLSLSLTKEKDWGEVAFNFCKWLIAVKSEG